MPLFGGRKRKEQEAQRQAEQQRALDDMQDAAHHYLAVLRLREAGQMDMQLSGVIDEEKVLVTLSDVHREWSRIAAHADLASPMWSNTVQTRSSITGFITNQHLPALTEFC